MGPDSHQPPLPGSADEQAQGLARAAHPAAGRRTAGRGLHDHTTRDLPAGHGQTKGRQYTPGPDLSLIEAARTAYTITDPYQDQAVASRQLRVVDPVVLLAERLLRRRINGPGHFEE
ncbi:hypothetical protein [Streptomyces sp. NPDC058695]|uniref:hypothetical protein n=1 Tax=Streptomyces sp. NPDC058695 TaxID=3346604 RepID=UPI003653B044